MKCKICGGVSAFVFKAKMLYKYEVWYYSCMRCGFLQTEEPFWLDEAYQSAINVYDTGILNRNDILARKLALLLFFAFGYRVTYLDYAGGYGLLVRKMRDAGFDFYWLDKYSTNLFARGFTYEGKKKVALVTAVEVFEHLNEPIVDIEEMLSYSRNIFFTTTLLPQPIPKPSEWWYYGFEHGQHIAFYSQETLQFIANKYNLHLVSFGDYHLFSEKHVPKAKFYILLFLANAGFSHLIKLYLHGKIRDDMALLKKKKLH